MSDSLKYVLTDLSSHLYVENLTLDSGMLRQGGNASWSISKTRLKGGLSDGVDLIEVNNGRFTFSILPTRGMTLWRGSCDGIPVGWNSPVKDPVNPMFVKLEEEGGCGWLRGFNENIVRCGLNSNGGPGVDQIKDDKGNVLSETNLTLHGKIQNTPARYVEIEIIPGEIDQIIVRGIVEESRIFAPQMRLVTTYSTFAGSNAVTFHDEVTNLADCPTELEMIYHCNFGEPFLGKGSQIVLPTLDVVPRDDFAAQNIQTWDTYLDYTPGFSEQCYFHDMATREDGSTLSMLKNQDSDKGVVLRYNKKQLPYFCQWKRTAGRNEGYVTGMEPALNYPNHRSFERANGRVISLVPQQTYTMEVTMEVVSTSQQVAAIEKEVASILGTKKRVLHQAPVSTLAPL